MITIHSIQINIEFDNNAERVTIAHQLSAKGIKYNIQNIQTKSLSIIINDENDYEAVSKIIKKFNK